MSFHGEPSAMLRCQVQLCGYGPWITLKPALFRLSTASGAGDAQMGSDGVKFLTGNLVNVGIVTGLVTFDANGDDVLTLYNTDKAVLSCTPR